MLQVDVNLTDVPVAKTYPSILLVPLCPCIDSFGIFGLALYIGPLGSSNVHLRTVRAPGFGISCEGLGSGGAKSDGDGDRLIDGDSDSNTDVLGDGDPDVGPALDDGEIEGDGSRDVDGDGDRDGDTNIDGGTTIDGDTTSCGGSTCSVASQHTAGSRSFMQYPSEVNDILSLAEPPRPSSPTLQAMSATWAVLTGTKSSLSGNPISRRHAKNGGHENNSHSSLVSRPGTTILLVGSMAAE
jgi:hypothetical protein